MANENDPILREILLFCEAHNTTKSAAGRKLINDPNLVFDLEGGREVRRATRLAIREKLAELSLQGHE